MGAFLFLLLLFIPPLLAMKSENTPSRSFDDDEVDFGDEIAKGWMGDMSSRYYMMFNND